MKAVYLTGHGGNEVVAIGERPRPVRRAGDVLVRLRAATVNRVDL
jgi:NADPH:quinone reductase-like Zn-dependent oxidoreductase